MKRVLAFSAILLMVGLVTTVALVACGDKFLVVSRGTRFQVPAVRRPAAILVYAHPSSHLSGALTNASLDAILQKAGYQPTVVVADDVFGDALGRGGWDLVVTDIDDARAIANRFRNIDPPPVLPIAYKPTKAELVRAQTEFRHVMKSPMTGQSFLNAVDDALAARHKTGN